MSLRGCRRTAARARGRGTIARGRREGFVSTPLPSTQIRPLGETGAAVPQSVTDANGATVSASSSRSATPASSDHVTLEGLFDVCRDMTSLIRTMDSRLRSVETKSIKVASAVKELNDYIKKYCKGTFTVKGSSYETPIKQEMAKLFLSDLSRKPSDLNVRQTVSVVLGTDGDRHRFDVLHTYAKNKLTDFRTDERRKVIGLQPYENACYQDTPRLCDQIINSLLPSSSEIEVDRGAYLKHLVLLRKFVRDVESVPSTNFYVVFREWIDTNFPVFNDAIWSELLQEDENIDYTVTGNGRTNTCEEELVFDGEAGIPIASTEETVD